MKSKRKEKTTQFCEKPSTIGPLQCTIGVDAHLHIIVAQIWLWSILQSLLPAQAYQQLIS